MNKEIAEIQYLAGVLNENQYNEIFGFGGSSVKSPPDKKEINFGVCKIDILNNDMHIRSLSRSEEEGLPPQGLMSAIFNKPIDKTIKITDDQVEDLINLFKDDFASDNLQMHKELGIQFRMNLYDTKVKLIDNDLYFDDGGDFCHDFNCKLTLTPQQIAIIKPK